MPTQIAVTRPHAYAAEAPVSEHLEAALSYIIPGAGKPVIDATSPGERTEANFSFAARKARVANGWLRDTAASLDREGFAVTRHETAVRDFQDETEIKEVYYPEMVRLLKEATGASRVLVFDHNLRIDVGDGPADGQLGRPVRRVHNDYTEASAPRRLADLLGPGADPANQRFAVINVWRSIRGPVLTAPLALADAQSVEPRDLVAADLVYPDRTGEIYYAAYNPRHCWVYYPQMDRNEALLIKGYDSLDDGRARFALHTAFDDPATPPNAAPRESIEVRALVFFD